MNCSLLGRKWKMKFLNDLENDYLFDKDKINDEDEI